MKRLFVFVFVVLFLLGMTACRATPAEVEEPEETPSLADAMAEEEEDDEEPTEIIMPDPASPPEIAVHVPASPSELTMYDAPSIVGEWVYTHSTERNGETPVSVVEFEGTAPRIEIAGDFVFDWFGTTHTEGILIRTGVYTYVVSDRGPGNDTSLQYESGSGLLRYAFDGGYHFFERS